MLRAIDSFQLLSYYQVRLFLTLPHLTTSNDVTMDIFMFTEMIQTMIHLASYFVLRLCTSFSLIRSCVSMYIIPSQVRNGDLLEPGISLRLSQWVLG